MAKLRHQQNKKRRRAFSGYGAALQAAARVADEKTKTGKERGLYKKYELRRVDGGNEPGKKHYGCKYFVLDITHDPHAIPAAFAYANSADADGYHALARDIYGMIQPFIKALNAQLSDEVGEDVLRAAEIAILPSDKLIAIASNVWANLDGEDALIIQELIERYQNVTKWVQATQNSHEAVMLEMSNPDLAEYIETAAAPTIDIAEVVAAALPPDIAAKPKVSRKKKI